MTLDLRPLSLGELLDRSFRLFRRHFWLFVGLMTVPSVLVLAINIAMLVMPRWLDAPSDPETGPELASLVAAAAGAVVIVVLALLYFATYVVTIGAMTIAVSELYLARSPTIASAFVHVRSHAGRLILLMILIGLRLFGIFIAVMAPFMVLAIAAAVVSRLAAPLVTVLGMLAAMVATFAFSLRYAVSVPALVLEPITAGGAIQRSIHLVRNHYWRTAVLVVFATIIATAANFLFQAPFQVGAFMAGPESPAGFWWQLAGSVSGAIGGAVTGPLMIVALAVLYYDLRIRKEGLDLEIMMARLDAHKPSGSAPATAAG